MNEGKEGELTELEYIMHIFRNKPDILDILNPLKEVNHKNKITINTIYKIVSDTKLLQNIDEESLKGIIKGSDNAFEIICELVKKTYGKDAEYTVRELKDIRDIKTFQIFDERIRSMLGHWNVKILARSIEDEDTIAQIVNYEDPQIVEYYKEFDKTSRMFFKSNIIGLNKKLEYFISNIDSIKQILKSDNKQEYMEELHIKLLEQYCIDALENIKAKFANYPEFLQIISKIDYKQYDKIVTIDKLLNINCINSTNDIKSILNFDTIEEICKFVNYEYGEEACAIIRDELVDENALTDNSKTDNSEDKTGKYDFKKIYIAKKMLEISSLNIFGEDNLECVKKLINLRKTYKNNPEISSFLKKIDYVDAYSIKSLEKIFSNSKIAENATIKHLESIIQNDNSTFDAICDLVKKTYGEDAERILRERPQLKMRDIPNFYIFEETIREIIGYGGVHTYLTYYMESEKIIEQIAKNPEMARYYKEFEKLTGDFFPPSAIGLEEKLTIFQQEKDLIQQIVDSGHPEDYAEKLLLYLTDKENLDTLIERNAILHNIKHHPTIFPKEDFKTDTLEDLENYYERREKILKTYWSNENCRKSDIMRFKYFGRMLHAGDYSVNVEKLFEDYIKFNRANLTDEELDVIELYSIWNSTCNSSKGESFMDTLEQLFSQSQDVILPVQMRKISYKIAEMYKQEYLDSLITVEKATEMAKEAEAILSKCADSIEQNEKLDELKTQRYIIKKDDTNIYFSNYMETPEGEKKYRDCIVTKNKQRKCSISLSI